MIDLRIRSERGRFKEVLGARGKAKVLMEASTESEWVARCLEELGHEVVVADPNFAPMYGMRTRRVKTDKRDARALADACASGTYREAHRTPEARRQTKALLAVRDALVRARAKNLTLMGALVRQQGLRVATGSAEKFPQRLAKVELPTTLKESLEPLMEVVMLLKGGRGGREVVCDGGGRRGNEETVHDAQRWASDGRCLRRHHGPHQVPAYLGLVPSERSSGEKQQRGHITKTGNGKVRRLLVQVALSTMRLKKAASKPLWEWATRIEEKRGRKVAVVALARKTAGILFAMLRDEAPFKARGKVVEPTTT